MLRLRYCLVFGLLSLSSCKSRVVATEVDSSDVLSDSMASACVTPEPLVLFMPGCGFASCDSEKGMPWLTQLIETLDGIIPASRIQMVPYTASHYPSAGGFAKSVRNAMNNRCNSLIITAGASAGDTIGSHLATHPMDFGLPRPVDAHIGLYGPKQFLYYKQHPELQGVKNDDANPPISALANLAAYANGQSDVQLYIASPQTYASATNRTRVFTSMGTLDRRINKDTGTLFFQALGGSRNGFNVLHTCQTGAHGYHFNGKKGTNPVDSGGAEFGGGSCPDLRAEVRRFVCSVINKADCPVD